MLFYYFIILYKLSHLTKYNDNRIGCFLSSGFSQQEAFSNCLSKFTLVLSIIKQNSLDSLKKSFSNGSLKLTRLFKFRLEGSKMNWHNTFSFYAMSSKCIWFWVEPDKVLNSSNNRLLSTSIPVQVEIT